MKLIAVLLATATYGFSAQALTVKCEAEKPVVLTLTTENPSGAPSAEWKMTIDGRATRLGWISVVSGPRHRRGIDGYNVEIRRGAGPLSPRTVYSFWTRGCVENGGELQMYTGAGVGRNRPVGNPMNCTCSE